MESTAGTPLSSQIESIAKETETIDDIDEELETLLRSAFSNCPQCKELYSDYNWCQSCEVQKFQEHFGKWTGGNDAIDNLIKETQLNALTYRSYLEWIPYSEFNNIELIGKGGFGTVYSAIWADGPKWNFDNTTGTWVKLHQCSFVSDFVLRCYGISQHPATGDYIMVMEYADNGDLYRYMRNHFDDISWYDKLAILRDIAMGLTVIHSADLLHRNLHTGNILLSLDLMQTYLTDLGLCRPSHRHVDYDEVYGSLPYVAPEVLQGEEYSKAADIFSFGIIMWEIATGKKAYGDRAHDTRLAVEICRGKRLDPPENVPECYIRLMNWCWDEDQDQRPDADVLHAVIGRDWLSKLKPEVKQPPPRRKVTFEKAKRSNSTPTRTTTQKKAVAPPVLSAAAQEANQFKAAEKKRREALDAKKASTNGLPENVKKDEELHPEAVYTSRNIIDNKERKTTQIDKKLDINMGFEAGESEKKVEGAHTFAITKKLTIALKLYVKSMNVSRVLINVLM
ncbi:6882_t:CDS:2 [Paraglomus brasilianum]|uniref:6882_t:CDS:1 n=1 Tax=Paraglomus brasilianum TaxID=144538 RepID=A0A9N9BL90_9GLOM|nr:6882_t:CDS:2 [Paraglomus brasilianum]